MNTVCDYCGKPIARAKPRAHNFCSTAHRNEWMKRNVDFAELSRGHKARHLTRLNYKRNPLCRVADRGKPNSKKARQAAAEYLGRPLEHGEVVHHLNGNATDNRQENLLIMPDRQHRQLHMALAIEQMEEGEENAEK